MTDTPSREDLLREQYADATNFNARVELSRRFSTNPQGWHRWVWEQLDLPVGGRVLELGAGPGYFWWVNRERSPAGLAVVLSDFSPGMLAQARGLLAATGRSFGYVVADAQQIPLAAASCDVVIANHMLYHVHDKLRAFAEIRRVLRPGGRFVASTLGEHYMDEVRDLLRRYALAAGREPRTLHRLDFTLENGADWLRPWFPAVTLRRYPDSLMVREAEPLVAYIYSLTRRPVPASDPRRAALTAFVAQEIAAHGPLHIGKDSGLFIADAPPPG